MVALVVPEPQQTIHPYEGLRIYGRRPRNAIEAAVAARTTFDYAGANVICWGNDDQPQAPPIDDSPLTFTITNESAKERSAPALRGAAKRAAQRAEAALRMCMRAGLPLTIKYLDYRYWQCRRCGFNANDEMIWGWWIALHWTNRDEVLAMSRRRFA